MTKTLERVTAKPFVKWAGGKTKLLLELIARLPESYNNYHEPFLGGGALYFNLLPENAILSDRNFELILCYKVIRDFIDDLIIDLKRHVYEKDYYYSLREADRDDSFLAWDSVRRASRFIYLNKTCYNGLYRVNSKGQFNVPFGKYTNPTICDEENLRACSEILQGVTVEARDYLTIEVNANSGDFVYLDPPYHPINETSDFTTYTPGGFGAEDQQYLADMCIDLSKRGVKFMLSNSDCEFIRSLYQGFNIEQVQATRSVNSKSNKRGKVNELIIRNY